MRSVVVGGGIAGLVAARRLMRRGDDVVVLESSDRLGGRIRSTDLAGLRIDCGAESFAVRGGVVGDLLAELGLTSAVVDPEPGGAWLSLPDRTVPLPAAGLLGIPAVPLADDVRAVIGNRAAWRAYADRLIPVLRVGRYDRLGQLVRRRMGDAVLERLVAPIVESVYGADPDDVPVDVVAPQLNGAITQVGSLSGAVDRLRSAAPAGSAVGGLRGGVFRLVDVFEAEFQRFGIDVRLGSPVRDLRFDREWSVTTDQGDFAADRVLVAADGAAALTMLRPSIPALDGLAAPSAAVSRAVLLAVDEPRLDAAPRGSGVLRAAATPGIRATAITHSTAKWGWLRESLPVGRHVLRLSYRGDEPVSDAEAVADASALLGVTIPPPVDRADMVWIDTAPALATETLALRTALEGAELPPGLETAGSWRAGTGLASVVRSAETAVTRLLS